MQYDEPSNGREIELRSGDEFAVSLPETRTAGYRWTVGSDGRPTLLCTSDHSAPNQGQVGGSGRHEWHFRAATEGWAVIEMHYGRPWENDAKPERTFTLKVRVRP